MRALVLGLVVLVALSGGCKKAREKAEEAAIEQATGQKMTIDDKDGKGITLTAPDGGGSITINPTEIPADFPKSIPIYPGAKVKTAMKTSSAGKQSFIVGLETGDPPDKVATFYKSQLRSWTSKADLNTGEGHLQSFEDATAKIGLTVTATRSAGADATEIGLLTAPL
jgi:hypothetical protein